MDKRLFSKILRWFLILFCLILDIFYGAIVYLSEFEFDFVVYFILWVAFSFVFIKGYDFVIKRYAKQLDIPEIKEPVKLYTSNDDCVSVFGENTESITKTPETKEKNNEDKKVTISDEDCVMVFGENKESIKNTPAANEENNKEEKIIIPNENCVMVFGENAENIENVPAESEKAIENTPIESEKNKEEIKNDEIKKEAKKEEIKKEVKNKKKKKG